MRLINYSTIVIIYLVICTSGCENSRAIQFFPLRPQMRMANRLNNELLKQISELDLSIPDSKHQKQQPGESLPKKSPGDDPGKLDRLVEDIIEQSLAGQQKVFDTEQQQQQQQQPKPQSFYHSPVKANNFISSYSGIGEPTAHNLFSDCRWRSGMAVGTTGYRLPCRDNQYIDRSGFKSIPFAMGSNQQQPAGQTTVSSATMNAALERLLDELQDKNKSRRQSV